MTYFTQEDLKPSEKTLNIIRQIAHNYRVVIGQEGQSNCCFN